MRHVQLLETIFFDNKVRNHALMRDAVQTLGVDIPEDFDDLVVEGEEEAQRVLFDNY